MSGPKRNPDKLNTIGVVVVGICGAVLVYVTIVALQAFYMNDTSEIQTMADYGGQDTNAKTHRAAEMSNISDKIDEAMRGVVDSAKTDPSHLVPGLPPATKPTVEPVFGRPKALAPAAPAPAAPAPAEGSGSGSGSAAPATEAPAPKAPAPTPAPKAPAPAPKGAHGK